MRAYGTGNNPYISISVTQTDGLTSFLSGDVHLVSPDYRWYSTPVFSTEMMQTNNDGELEIQIEIPQVGDGKVYVDKLMVIHNPDDVAYFNNPSLTAWPGQVSDPLDPDSDFDGCLDGKEIPYDPSLDGSVSSGTYDGNSDIFWWEAEEIKSSNAIIVNDVLAGNGEAVKKSNVDNKLIDSSKMISHLQTSSNYRMYIRAKKTTPAYDPMFITVGSLPLPTVEAFELTVNEYRWYISSPFNGGVGSVDLSYDSVYGAGIIHVDKIMLVSTNKQTPGQISDPLDPDCDWDDSKDGNEINNDIFWFECEHYATSIWDEKNDGGGIVETSNSKAAKPTYNTGPMWDIASYESAVTPGHYQVFIRAKNLDTPCDLIVDLDGPEYEIGDEQTYSFSLDAVSLGFDYNYYWFETGIYDATLGYLKIELKSNGPDVLVDKFMFVSIMDDQDIFIENNFGRCFSDPLDPDIDWDNYVDGEESDRDVLWFESESYAVTGTSIQGYNTNGIEYMPSNFKEVKRTTQGDFHLLETDINAGSYKYFVRARGFSTNTKPQLKLIVLDEDDNEIESETIVLQGDYRWYSMQFTLDIVDFVDIFSINLITRFTQTNEIYPEVYCDKFILATIEDFTITSHPTPMIPGLMTLPVSSKSSSPRFGSFHSSYFQGIYRVTPGEVSDPFDYDSDYDMLSDGQEVHSSFNYQSEPLARDGDMDSLWDCLEVGAYLDIHTTSTTNPNMADTDWDMIPDGWLDGWGYNTVSGKWEFNVITDSGYLDVMNIGLYNNFHFLEYEDQNLNGYVDTSETDPDDWDTDDDSIGEGVEIVIYTTLPLDDDTDDDGLTDYEIITYGTDPLDDDSDDDNLNDGLEVGISTPQGDDTDPTWVGDGDQGATTTNPLDIDSDKDGLPDGWIDGWGYCTTTFQWGEGNNPSNTVDQWDIGEGEDKNLNGKFENTWSTYQETHPRMKDTDGGGLSDPMELLYNQPYNIDQTTYSPNPANNMADDQLSSDTDEDGLINFIETANSLLTNDADSDDDGIEDGDEFYDLDGDGTLDASEYDTDNDGLGDGLEIGMTTAIPGGQGYVGTSTLIFVPDSDPSTTTLPADDDTDDDGIKDGNEDSTYGAHNGKVDSGESDPNKFDSDGDQLPDGLEIGLTSPQGSDTDSTKFIADQHSSSTTDPTSPDSDGDGLWDGFKNEYDDPQQLSNEIMYDYCFEVGEDVNINGKRESYETDPSSDDTDGDTLKDGYEWAHGSNDLFIFDLEDLDDMDDNNEYSIEFSLPNAEEVKDSDAIDSTGDDFSAVESKENENEDPWSGDEDDKMFKLSIKLPTEDVVGGEFDIHFRMRGVHRSFLNSLDKYFYMQITQDTDSSGLKPIYYDSNEEDAKDFSMFWIPPIEEYNWYSMKNIKIEHKPVLSTDKGSVVTIYGYSELAGLRLDRMIIINNKADPNKFDYIQNGQLIDPTRKDSDCDGIADNIELNTNVWWFEAEDTITWDYYFQEENKNKDLGFGYPSYDDDSGRFIYTGSSTRSSGGRVVYYNEEMAWSNDGDPWPLLYGPQGNGKDLELESGNYICGIRYEGLFSYIYPNPEVKLEIYQDNFNGAPIRSSTDSPADERMQVYKTQFTVSTKANYKIKIFVKGIVLIDSIFFVKEVEDVTDEVNWITHPLIADTDWDGLWDGWGDLNQNGVFNTGEPKGEDNNGDGTLDSYPNHPYTDTDEISDYDEVVNCLSDPLEEDTDDNGIDDHNEVEYRMILDINSGSPSWGSIYLDIAYLSEYKNRLTGSENGELASGYIERQFNRMGLSVARESHFYCMTPYGGDAYDYYDNLIATLPGTSDDYYIICAHYDTTLDSGGTDRINKRMPGADDDASGVGALLDIARCLKTYKDQGLLSLDYTIKFIAFSCEEQSQDGSYRYYLDHKDVDTIKGVINLDMIGYNRMDQNGKTNTITIDSNDYSSDQDLATLISTVEDVNDDYELGLTIIKYIDTHSTRFGRSDHIRFMDHYPSIMIIEELCPTGPYYEHYHKETDTLDNLDMNYLRKNAILGGMTAYRLAS